MVGINNKVWFTHIRWIQTDRFIKQSMPQRKRSKKKDAYQNKHASGVLLEITLILLFLGPLI